MEKQKGFTIVELIVVIAIIAILAGIVIVNATSYVQKSRVASIKMQLSNLMVDATKYFEQNSTYSGFCNSSDAKAVITGMYFNTNLGAGGCVDPGGFYSNPGYAVNFGTTSNGGWVACANIPPGPTPPTSWCVDSNGAKKLETDMGSNGYCYWSLINGSCL